jgi:hypothetical protein
LGFEQSEIRENVFLKSDYITFSSRYFSIGRNGFKHFKKDFYFNLMLNVGLGNEKLTDFSFQETNRFLAGLETSQGLLYIPKSKFGFALGLGVFEKLSTSKIYSFDFGIVFSLGITI